MPSPANTAIRNCFMKQESEPTSLQAHPPVNQIREEANEQHLKSDKRQEQRKDADLVFADVIARAFQKTEQHEQQRGWHEHVERLEIGANPNDQNREIR